MTVDSRGPSTATHSPQPWKHAFASKTVLKTTLFMLGWFAVSNLLVLNLGRTTLIIALTAPVLNLGIPWWIVYRFIGGGQTVATLLLVMWFYGLSVIIVHIARTALTRVRRVTREPHRTRNGRL
jgi:hypothetical protein